MSILPNFRYTQINLYIRCLLLNLAYKIINFSVKVIIFLVILLHLVVYGIYRYELKDIDLTVYTAQQALYKSDYYSTLWVFPKTRPLVHKKPTDIKMKPIYPIYDIAEYFMGNHIVDPSYKISYWVVNNLSKLRHQHIRKYAIQVWLSHHLTLEATANLYLKSAYYGHGYSGLEAATKGYFQKKPNELNHYEIVMLVALTYSPSSLNPKRHPKKLLEKMNELIFKLKYNFPLYYKNLTYQKRLPSSLI